MWVNYKQVPGIWKCPINTTLFSNFTYFSTQYPTLEWMNSHWYAVDSNNSMYSFDLEFFSSTVHHSYLGLNSHAGRQVANTGGKLLGSQYNEKVTRIPRNFLFLYRWDRLWVPMKTCLRNIVSYTSFNRRASNRKRHSAIHVRLKNRDFQILRTTMILSKRENFLRSGSPSRRVRTFPNN